MPIPWHGNMRLQILLPASGNFSGCCVRYCLPDSTGFICLSQSVHFYFSRLFFDMMRRLTRLLCFFMILIAGLPAALAWPEIRTENFSGHRQWRDERQEEKRRVIQERRERQERYQPQDNRERRQEEQGNERRALSPEERRELRQQIRRANQERNR